MEKKKRFLVLIESYLPGFKNGGHGRSITNLVDFYSNQYDFYIYTSDRDFGDKHPYPNIKRNCWTKVNGANVMYNKPLKLWFSIAKIIKNNDIDVVYTCGFFSNYTLRLLLSKWLNNINIPIVIAPMGQFGPNALKFKSLLKSLIIKIINITNILKKTNFSVTSYLEDKDVKLKLRNINSFIIEDLPTKYELKKISNTIKYRGYLSTTFISRIHPSKNLLEALHILKNVSGDVNFDIYGIIEDHDYWEKCKAEISILPENIHAKYCGEIYPSLVPETFSHYDVFIFPTLGENYGHVIFESISGACIPVISDKTPWNDIDKYSCGSVYPLGNIEKAVEIIQNYINMDNDELSIYKENAILFYERRYREKLNNPQFTKMISEILK